MQKRTIYQEATAEMMGTLFILLFGCGVNAMNTLFNLGGYVNIAFSWGIGVFLGILVSARISGAHLNPAITIALVLIKRFPPHKAPWYILGQMVGGFLGAAIVYFFYHAKFMQIDPTLAHTAAIFTTFPAMTGTFLPGFYAEIIATAILMFGVLSIIDHFACSKAPYLSSFAIGLLIVGIGMAFGGMHGYAMNIARDLSPRIFISLVGFKNTGLTDGSGIWAASVFGSLIGAVVGAFLYEWMIHRKPSPQLEN